MSCLKTLWGGSDGGAGLIKPIKASWSARREPTSWQELQRSVSTEHEVKPFPFRQLSSNCHESTSEPTLRPNADGTHPIGSTKTEFTRYSTPHHCPIPECLGTLHFGTWNDNNEFLVSAPCGTLFKSTCQMSNLIGLRSGLNRACFPHQNLSITITKTHYEGSLRRPSCPCVVRTACNFRGDPWPRTLSSPLRWLRKLSTAFQRGAHMRIL